MRYERSLREILGKDLAKVYARGNVAGISFHRPVMGEIHSVADALRLGRDRQIGWAINERNLLAYYLPKYNLTDDVRRTLGLWGSPEPSFNAWITGSREQIIAMAKDWGKSYNQEAVALLLHNPDGTGGALGWDFGRQLSILELDQVLGGIQAVNKRLTELAVRGMDTGGIEMIGMTVIGRRRLEFWVGDQITQIYGKDLIEEAIRLSGLEIPESTFEGGFDFMLLFRGADY